jgi:hypothetical protein
VVQCTKVDPSSQTDTKYLEATSAETRERVTSRSVKDLAREKQHSSVEADDLPQPPTQAQLETFKPAAESVEMAEGGRPEPPPAPEVPHVQAAVAAAACSSAAAAAAGPGSAATATLKVGV